MEQPRNVEPQRHVLLQPYRLVLTLPMGPQQRLVPHQVHPARYHYMVENLFNSLAPYCLYLKKRCSLPKLSFRFQCTATDGCDASSTSPFCGTSASNNGGANDVDVGVCGKCQLTAGGGGIVTSCLIAKHWFSLRPWCVESPVWHCPRLLWADVVYLVNIRPGLIHMTEPQHSTPPVFT